VVDTVTSIQQGGPRVDVRDGPTSGLMLEQPGGARYLGEGIHVVLRNRVAYPPDLVFRIALATSLTLDGKLVLCRGIMPGVSLLIESQPEPMISAGAETCFDLSSRSSMHSCEQ
jgi:hypothetical protein